MCILTYLVYREEVSEVVVDQVEVQGVFVQVVTGEPQLLLPMTRRFLYWNREGLDMVFCQTRALSCLYAAILPLAWGQSSLHKNIHTYYRTCVPINPTTDQTKKL